jgi:hypothetical protein
VKPEARFVTLCVRVDALEEELRLAAEAVRDWSQVAAMSDRHWVTGFVLRVVARHELRIPAEIRRRMHDTEVVKLAHRMLLEVELERVASALAAEEFSMLLLKGPAVARTLYPDPALRPYGDLDVTVQDAGKDVLVAKLLNLGFTERPCPPKEDARTHAEHLEKGADFHREFVTRDEQVVMELHADALQLGLNSRCEVERWARTVPVPGLPGAVMLGPEDQLVQLALHAHKHGFSRLIWLKDIDLLLRVHADALDWDLVEKVSDLEGVGLSVWYSLLLAKRLFQTPYPESLEKDLRPNRLLRALYGRVWSIRDISELNGHMRRYAVQFHPQDRWRGTVPNLVLMPRRGDRARGVVRSILNRRRETRSVQGESIT